MKYTFALSYTTEPVACLRERAEKTESEFRENLTAFLIETYAVESHETAAIAATLLARMTGDSRIKYHSPVHVLSIFQFAQENGIELESWEHLALWFHDAIYVPLASDNEARSAMLMQALLPLPNNALLQADCEKAVTAILATAHHELPTEELAQDSKHLTGAQLARVMDLDLWGFTSDEATRINNDLVWQEFEELVPSRDLFDEGRKQFFQKLIAKGYLFRSPEFQQFEEIGMRNALRIIG